MKYIKGKSNLVPILVELNSSNVVVNKRKSNAKNNSRDTDNRGGRHSSSRDDAERGRDA
ncbi:hypothetical protein ACQKP0_14970 [Heyndrickxia sp. NPDC080065]|uniref:hypothetical protein n=1 Tax=Heyndrickxia sp. NPDC080065 TaxID=3390568 RepID=UPI003D042168